MTALLELDAVDVSYGSVHALRSVSMSVNAGENVALIGANGAGKSTLLRTVCGLAQLGAGNINYKGMDIGNASAHEVASKRISMVPEGRRIFPYMSVLDNLRLGAHRRTDRSSIQADLETVQNRFPRLRERRRQLGGSLSGGEQQMVAIGRALMSRPQLLLLDEPSLGLAPMLVRQIAKDIRAIQSEWGVSILLVEQNARMALSLASSAFVLESGRIALHGPANEMIANDRVRELYLGG